MRERQGELASGPSTHLSTQHGVGSSDTHRNRLNLLFPPPPVHYYGPPCRANATLLLSSHPLPCSRSPSVWSVAPRSSSLFVILPFFSFSFFFFFLKQISPSLCICFFSFSAVQRYLSSKVKGFSWNSVRLIERRSPCDRKGSSDRLFIRSSLLTWTWRRGCISLPTLSNPPVPLVCFRAHFSPHCW